MTARVYLITRVVVHDGEETIEAWTDRDVADKRVAELGDYVNKYGEHVFHTVKSMPLDVPEE